MRHVTQPVWSLIRLLAQPVDRLAEETPRWGWGLAWVGGAWQWLRGDAFTQLLFLIIAIAACDYYYGTKHARADGLFSPDLARRGWHGKASGIVLLLGVRLFEGWAAAHAFVDTRGGVATALGIALLTVDLQSIAHHRERFGAAPIPVLSAVLAWMRSVGPVRIPTQPSIEVRPTPPRREEPDA